MHILKKLTPKYLEYSITTQHTPQVRYLDMKYLFTYLAMSHAYEAVKNMYVLNETSFDFSNIVKAYI